MAFPTITTRVGTSISTAGTSHAINVGSPAAASLLIIYARFAGDPGATTFTGYTAFAGPDATDASDDSNTLYYRQADGTEGVSDTLTTTNSVKAAVICFVIAGAADPAIQAPETSVVAVGTGANANSTIVTPTGGANDYLFLITLGLDGETQTASVPANYIGAQTTNIGSGTGGAVATNCIIWMGPRNNLNAASEDPGAWTSSAPATGWTAWTVAVHPPVAPAAPPTLFYVTA